MKRTRAEGSGLIETHHCYCSLNIMKGVKLYSGFHLLKSKPQKIKMFSSNVLTPIFKPIGLGNVVGFLHMGFSVKCSISS